MVNHCIVVNHDELTIHIEPLSTRNKPALEVKAVACLQMATGAAMVAMY